MPGAGERDSWMKRKPTCHSSEQLVKKLRDADVMLGSGKSFEEIQKMLEAGEPTLARWRSHYGALKIITLIERCQGDLIERILQ